MRPVITLVVCKHHELTQFVFTETKTIENWRNEGTCSGTGSDPSCGEGTIVQIRNCTDGTEEKCTEQDRRRSVACDVAGEALPACCEY